MALTFNGTSSKLVHTGSVGGLITAYPFTLFCWVKQPTSALQNGFPFLIEGIGAEIGSGGNGSTGIFNSTSEVRAYQSVGSGIGAFSALPPTNDDVWRPAMAVFRSVSSRSIWFRTTSTEVTDTTTFSTLTMSGFKIAAAGCRSIAGDNFFKGDIACCGLWSMEFTDTEWTTLSGGAVPSTVQSGSLVEYWNLLTQGATQVGVNGKSMTATSTSQAASHPITEGGASFVNRSMLMGIG